mgnify:CR=1 FL=1
MRNMDDHDHSSLVEALLSGFVNKKDNVDAQYEPTLIANHDGRTMEYAIKDELQRSQDFDMSIAFVSQARCRCLSSISLISPTTMTIRPVESSRRRSIISTLPKHSGNC